jgi:DnaJ domain
MNLFTAASVLGISLNACRDKKSIEKAWKQKLLTVHPDKCSHLSSHEQTQAVNEAKEVLIEHFMPTSAQEKMEKQQREHEEEQKKQAEEQKKRSEEQRKNKKKRPEGARIHRKIEEYQEGKAFIEEMKKFVKEHFEPSDCIKVVVNIILLSFIATRGKTTTLEQNLFSRHIKRLMLAEWPHTKYTVFRGQRCYTNLRWKY